MVRALRGAAFAGTALAPAVAWSATVCVDPANSSCHPTIQAGVNAAAPGDTVTVARGRYRETVSILRAKVGLKLIGSGTHVSIIEPDRTAPFFAIGASAPGVEVRDFGVRGGRGVGLLGNGGLIRGLRIVGTFPGTALEVRGLSQQVLDNEILAGNIGISIGSGTQDIVIAGNRIVQTASGVQGRDCTRCEVRDNVITMAQMAGIEIRGPNARLLRNTVIDVDQYGLYASGLDPVVEDNRVRHTGGNFVECMPCTGGGVRRNVSHSTPLRQTLDGTAWLVVGDMAGHAVEDNLASRSARQAFRLTGRLMQVSGNVAIETISTDGQAFRVEGRRHRLAENAAVRSAGSGYELFDHDHVLEANTSSGARVNGFVARSISTPVLRRNVAADSTASGFAVMPEAVGTRLEGNRGARNRYDFCDDGVGTIAGGNTFPTVSSVCDIPN
jgi:hypothetical protein